MFSVLLDSTHLSFKWDVATADEFSGCMLIVKLFFLHSTLLQQEQIPLLLQARHSAFDSSFSSILKYSINNTFRMRNHDINKEETETADQSDSEDSWPIVINSSH